MRARPSEPVATGRIWVGRLRFGAAIAVGRITAVLTRLVGHHGTALPGLVAERLDSALLGRLGRDLGPVVIVLGTNGKTTTTRLLARILERVNGSPPITNRSGANLRQGVVTALLERRPSTAGPPAQVPAVFEVDELAFAALAPTLRPTVVVVLNLLRDQLDRYGEIDTLEERWVRDFTRLPSTTTLVACADDPRVEAVARRSRRTVVRFGLGESKGSAAGASGARVGQRPSAMRDIPGCPSCGTRVVFGELAANGLGDWTCPACETRRAAPDLAVSMSGTDATGWLQLTFGGPSVNRTLPATPRSARVRLSGSAGAYDAAAAVLAAMALGIDRADAIAAVDGATPAFGRLEEVEIGGKRIVLTLAKNPASVAQAAEAAAVRSPDGLLIGLGDRPADGRDVSWIWDSEIEGLPTVESVTLTGSRADDLALRFKYATGDGRSLERRPLVERAVDRALDASLGRIRPGGTLMVLATYTTMLGIRRVLQQRGAVPALPG